MQGARACVPESKSAGAIESNDSFAFPAEHGLGYLLGVIKNQALISVGSIPYPYGCVISGRQDALSTRVESQVFDASRVSTDPINGRRVDGSLEGRSLFILESCFIRCQMAWMWWFSPSGIQRL